MKDDTRPKNHSPGRVAAWSALALAALCGPGPAPAQEVPPDPLDPVLVVATRTPEDTRTLGSAADLVSAQDLERMQLTSPADALGAVPGAPAFANGAPGSDVSAFLRGANSDQTLFLVDGIRLNDANTDYSVYLGGARLGATDSVEIVRGPQSTLYGSEAVGGVVSITALRGSGAPSSDFDFEAGSFASVSATARLQGTDGPWAWAVTADAAHTDNQRSNDAFDSADLVFRIDRDLSASASVGVTLRGFQGHYEDPGDAYTNDPYAYETESNWLGTVFATLKPAPDWAVKVTAGGQSRRYFSYDEEPGVFVSTSVVQNRRGVLDAQATYAGLTGQEITLGADLEDETTFDNGYGGIDERQTLFGAFAQDEWHPLASLYLTGGVRYDDFDTFGTSVTGRATAAWLSPDRAFKVRASYGTGFNAPSFLELYGTAVGYQGNPDLKPERSQGGDAGLDWYFPNHAGSLGVTWFRDAFRDLVVYDFSVYPGTTENLGKARTDGVEVEARYALSGFQFRAAYTYLDADDVTDGGRLLRRPRNSLSADVWRDFGSGWSAGAGVVAIDGMEDVDALSFLDVSDPGYAVVRLYARWEVTPRLAFKARIENLLDKKYEPVNGYPALGIGGFGGVEWKL